jgi:hypothetical protein
VEVGDSVPVAGKRNACLSHFVGLQTNKSVRIFNITDFIEANNDKYIYIFFLLWNFSELVSRFGSS